MSVTAVYKSLGWNATVLKVFLENTTPLGGQHPACCITKNQPGTVQAQSSRVLFQLPQLFPHCQASNFNNFTSLHNHTTSWPLFKHDHFSPVLACPMRSQQLCTGSLACQHSSQMPVRASKMANSCANTAATRIP